MLMAAIFQDSYRRDVEDGLRRFFPDTGLAEIVYEAMAYSLFAGGKRLRPILTLLAAEAAGGNKETAMPAACAVEYLHTYSLIHDDLPAMDNDDLRRGRPTCHIKFGEDIAILAGDALIAEAFLLVAADSGTGPEIGNRIVGELASAVSAAGMVGGQAMDLTLDSREAAVKIDVKRLEKIHELKTGRLIAAAARVGAMTAGADDTVMAAITAYAANVGLAFQVLDDILDITGLAATLGKNTGGDAGRDKVTFPVLIGIDESKKYAERLISGAKEALAAARLKKPESLIELADFTIRRQN